MFETTAVMPLVGWVNVYQPFPGATPEDQPVIEPTVALLVQVDVNPFKGDATRVVFATYDPLCGDVDAACDAENYLGSAPADSSQLDDLLGMHGW